ASRARNGAKFHALWTGDTSGYKSQSEADLALCNLLAFYCGPDPDRIDSLFCQSGLFRSKWQRDDYRQRTITLALQGRTEFYHGPPMKTNAAISQSDESAGNGKAATREVPEADERDPQAEATPSGDGTPVVGDPAHLTDRGNAI